jgi:hypothetical protein
VPVVLYGCVVAQENPHAPLRQVATSLSFSLPAIMLFAGFQCEIFGESPVTLALTKQIF